MDTSVNFQEWWRGGVIYQIYPRSFQDSNADGIGDLGGVLQRLPYLAQLGVDAIWLTPFFKSPMKDFGYDIADYCDVDPMFGTLADFDAVVNGAHELGIKVLIDFVASHCSDRNAWFTESRSSRDNPRADWFVWADPKADGTPPNNWLSMFGGSAWQWDTGRSQYYLHNFLSSQPDLNFHNPSVQDATLANMRFWLDRGIDGFRLDAINYCVHDALLRDNPPRDPNSTNDPNSSSANPYAYQFQIHTRSRPENLAFLRRIRLLMNEYPGTTTVGEIGEAAAAVRMAEYTGGGDTLHMAYSFDLLGSRCDARFVHGLIETYEATITDGWTCWSLANHDVTRLATRWQRGESNAAWLRLVFTLQICMRGALCIYQGDELGLPEAKVAFEDMQDPFGITMWPGAGGRDGCRTPMVWDRKAPHAGFSAAARTWLPVAPEHAELAATDQMQDPDSLFNFYRRALLWRRAHRILQNGTMELLPADDAVLAFVRRCVDGSEKQSLLCALNFGGSEVHYALPDGLRISDLEREHPLPPGTLDGQTLVLPPYGAVFATL